MSQDDSQTAAEKKILKTQYMALATSFVLFFVSAIPLILLFGNDIVKIIRIIIPIAYFPALFIGISSIKHKISIARPKGQRKHSTGKQAVVVGVLVIASFVLNLIILFSPLLDLLYSSFHAS